MMEEQKALITNVENPLHKVEKDFMKMMHFDVKALNDESNGVGRVV